MSFPAIAWALKQPVGRASAKFLLVAMADCVNAESTEMLCFPSLAYLSKVTDMDPKSVKANLQKLRELGFIEDSGERKGQTGRVVTYRLKSPEVSPPMAGREATQSAQISPPMSPNFPDSSDGAMRPNFPINEPKFPTQSAQISLPISPNLGHGTSKEPVMEPVKEPNKRAKESFNAAQMDLPDWLPREAWVMWAKERADRKKPITPTGARLQLRDLETFRARGHDPVAVIEISVRNGWQGLFEPKTSHGPSSAAGNNRTSLRHGGFEDLDYTVGLNEDGTLKA